MSELRNSDDDITVLASPDGLGEAGGGGQEVEQQPQVAVVVVDVVHLPQQLLLVQLRLQLRRARCSCGPPPRGAPQQLLVVCHEGGEAAPPGAHQPAQREEGAHLRSAVMSRDQS